ncbi:Disks large 1 tumor suppressor protein [Trichinella pseudospiralis]|uniref:Disks large 1 tumor suppressor protein n=1 Tax=Trichinella pseudospiralis TaxID=6337 RepID=A0A0V0XPB2_TRIPS|nr:Disks large 1 tumor suppressor protein [Trichinella pseudospiralis]
MVDAILQKAHRALELLEEYHKSLIRADDRQLREAIERVITIFKCRLFQALLGKFEFPIHIFLVLYGVVLAVVKLMIFHLDFLHNSCNFCSHTERLREDEEREREIGFSFPAFHSFVAGGKRRVKV